MFKLLIDSFCIYVNIYNYKYLLLAPKNPRGSFKTIYFHDLVGFFLMTSAPINFAMHGAESWRKISRSKQTASEIRTLSFTKGKEASSTPHPSCLSNDAIALLCSILTMTIFANFDEF